MIKIGKDPNLVPDWLRVNRPMVPDFVARDPKSSPVWEITGAEFTNQGVHTADSISIRFPRVTKIRNDKCWKTATSLKELRVLFDKSSTSMDFSLLLGTKDAADKKNSTLDDYVKPGSSGAGKSPAPSPRKKIKNELVSSGDEEDDAVDRRPSKSPAKRKVKRVGKGHADESSETENSDNEESKPLSREVESNAVRILFIGPTFQWKFGK